MKHHLKNRPSNGISPGTGCRAVWHPASRRAWERVRALGLALAGANGGRPAQPASARLPARDGRHFFLTGLPSGRLIRALMTAAVVLALGPLLARAADAPARPPAEAAGVAPKATAQGTKARSVLLLSGVQQGLPVPDSLVSNALAALKEKGISVTNIYAENLDLARHGDPASRAALAAMLRQKLAGVDIGLVILPNIASPAVMDFLAREGRDIVPADTPVMTVFPEKSTTAWAKSRPQYMNVLARPDWAGTLRYGLDLFPRTRRLLIVTDVRGGPDAPVDKVAGALASLGRHLDIEHTAALTYDELLQRVSSLPSDSLVLLSTYYQDTTGRRFIPAEVAADVAQRANAPVLVLYEAHVQYGLLGGSVLIPNQIGQRIGEIGFEVLSGTRRFGAGADEPIIPPQPMFDWMALQR